jgi:hypothetical protein
MDDNEHYLYVHVAVSPHFGSYWGSFVPNLFTPNSLVRRDLERRLVSSCCNLLDVETNLARLEVRGKSKRSKGATGTRKNNKRCATGTRKNATGCATDINTILFAMVTENKIL